MTDQERIAAKCDLAAQVASHIEAVMVSLHAEEGVPWDAILAGAHAQIVSAMTLHVGGPATLAAIQRAAKIINDLSSARAASLAYAEPAGRA